MLTHWDLSGERLWEKELPLGQKLSSVQGVTSFFFTEKVMLPCDREGDNAGMLKMAGSSDAETRMTSVSQGSIAGLAALSGTLLM